MTTKDLPPVAALRHSHDLLAETVGPLDGAQLRRLSYADEWTIAQVLSHLGSQAEIFGLFLDAGLSGSAAPGPDAFPAIWDRWNSRSPEEQAADALLADEAVTGRFESMDDEQAAGFRLRAFGMDLDVGGVAMLRLSEHAVHNWDIRVALDPVAVIAPDAVALLIDTLGRLASRSGKPDGVQRRVLIDTTEPERHLTFLTSDSVTITPVTGATTPATGDPARLRIPAEALVRLCYGRLDPGHTPPLEADGVNLDDLRRIFPGL
jgi:uncharacterized protein (TIGR03083 family)